MSHNASFWFICLFVLLIILEALFPLDFGLLYLREVGLFLLSLSLIIAIWSKYLYSRYHTSYNPDDKPLVLITHSLYAISRNPIYFALTLGFLGISLVLSLSYSLLGTFFLYLILSKLIIPHEEEELRKIFTQSYLKYESTVPKWL